MRLFFLLLLLCCFSCRSTEDAFTGTWMLQYQTEKLSGTNASRWGAGTLLMTFGEGEVWQSQLANRSAFIQDTMAYEQIGNRLEFSLDTTRAEYEIVEISRRRMVLSAYGNSGTPVYTVWEPTRKEQLDLGLEEIKELLMSSPWSAPSIEQRFEFLANGELQSAYASGYNRNLWWLTIYNGSYYLGLFDPNNSPTIVCLKSIGTDQIKGIRYGLGKKTDFLLERQAARNINSEQLVGEWALESRTFPVYEWIKQQDTFRVQEIEEQYSFDKEQLIYTRGEAVDSLAYNISPSGYTLLFAEWRSYWKGAGWQILDYDDKQLKIEMSRNGISERGFRETYRDTLVFSRR